MVHLDQVSGPAGTTVAAKATGFLPDEFLHLSVVGVEGVIVRSSGLADSDGAVTLTFTVPSEPVPEPGSYGVLVTATADTSRRASVDFHLTAGGTPAATAAPGILSEPSTPAYDWVSVLAAELVLPGPADASSTAVEPDQLELEPEPEPGLEREPEPELEVAPELVAPEPVAVEAVEAEPEPKPELEPEPEPVEPGPVEPEPVEPGPVEPGPVEPGPVEPEPEPGPQPELPEPEPVGLVEPEREPQPAPVPAPPSPSVAADDRPGAVAFEPPRARPRAPGPGRRPIGKKRRTAVGVALAGVVFGGGLLGASGLPSTPLSASLVAEPANAAGSATPPLPTPAAAVVPVPATSTAEQLGGGKAVTLAFGGDVHFEGALATRLAANPQTVLNAARPLYAGADITMVNLETAVTARGSPEPKQFTFRAPPSAYTALKAAGITLATQANNHGEDYGPDGLSDSITAAKQAGFPIIGIGNNAGEAFAPYRASVNGQRIAIVAATQVLDDNLQQQWTATDSHPGLASAYDLPHLLAAVRQARATSDTVVVYVHWGTETEACPNSLQQPLASQLVEAGADIVVGSHAHVLLGGGRLGGALVDYGLGNFAFYATASAQVESGVLKVTVTGRRIDAYQWVPGRISGGVPRPLAGGAAAAAERSWAQRRSCTNLAA